MPFQDLTKSVSRIMKIVHMVCPRKLKRSLYVAAQFCHFLAGKAPLTPQYLLIVYKKYLCIPRVISGTCMMLILPSSVPAMIWFSSKNLTTLTAACNLKWFKMFLPLKSINLTAPDSPPVTTSLPKVPTSSSFISLVSVHRILRLDSVISTVLTLSDSSITGSKVFCFPQLHKRNVPSLKKQ